MPRDYDALAEDLKAIGIPSPENAWNTRPTGDYITYALEYEAGADYGDNRKIARAWEGSIDLYSTDKSGGGYVEDIERALEANCESCWWMNTSGSWERETGLFHFEWVFQVEE